MDYLKIYNNFIKHKTGAMSPIKVRGLERHHIKPRSLGGSDNLTNLVDLTHREHFFAHKLLAKIHGAKMIAALFYMANIRRKNVPSRQYERYRQQYINICKNRIGNKNPFYGKSHTNETKDKISKKQKGKPIRGDQLLGFKQQWKSGPDHRWHKDNIDHSGTNNPFFGKIHSEKTRNIISIKTKERFKTKENHPLYNKGHSEEAKLKIKNNWNKQTVICPNCNKEGESRAMKRWHFENCKWA